MDTLEQAELTATIRPIARFLKSGIKIYNFEVLESAEEEDRQLQSVFRFTLA